MIMMGIGHVLMACYPEGRDSYHSWFFHTPGSVFSPAVFIPRFIGLICAPIFVFVAGTALAISVERRRAAGALEREIDRSLLIRGLVLIAIEFTWWFPLFIQILYAIGLGLICMILLRRLSNRLLLGLSLAFMGGGELLYRGSLLLSGLNPESLKLALQEGGPLGWHILAMPFISPGVIAKFGQVPLIVMYPLLPWLAVMVCGWVFGRYLVVHGRGRPRGACVERVLLVWGALGLLVFAIVRGLNGFGNMMLYREDFSWFQWLNVSKYPPSLTFYALEMGLMALLLWVFFKRQYALKRPANPYNPLVVFGQTAFFFYLIHLHLFFLAMAPWGLLGKMSMGGAYLASLVNLAILYPLCLWYRRFKATHPKSWCRYI